MRLFQQFLYILLGVSLLWLLFVALFHAFPTTGSRHEQSSVLSQHLETFTLQYAFNKSRDVDKRKASFNRAIPTEIDCYRLNSQAWLNSARLGNINDPNLLYQDILPSVDAVLQPILEQSICAQDSRFTATIRQHQNTTISSIHTWTMRLIYWSMHHHQTHHAQAEAKLRLGASCQQEDSYQVGPYDFECPNAKFIVASLANVGLGANVRGGMVFGYFAGLVSDRVVIFLNDSPVGHTFLRRPWALVSCSSDNDGTGPVTQRQDAQCFFLPSSPCVLMEADVDRAHKLSGPDTQRLIKQGKLPIGHEDDKVWFMQLGFTPFAVTPKLVAERLRDYSHQLIDSHLAHLPSRQLVVLRQAADNILTDDEPRSGYNYGAANVKVHHALVVYAMRLRRDKARLIKNAMIQLTKDAIDSEQSFGLPIRASDKCTRESECLSFEQHMEAMQVVWDDHYQAASQLHSSHFKRRPIVLFTTESSQMAREQSDFLVQHPDFRFRIATNTLDVTPDTGFITNSNMNASADDVLLSAVTSLRFQLMARVTLGNCCSNFHVMLADLLAAGCGAASTNDFHCFQEMKDPSLRICCGWFKDCKEKKLKEMMGLSNTTKSGD